MFLVGGEYSIKYCTEGKIIVMDTACDLPSNWTEMSFEDLLKKKRDNVVGAEADLVSSNFGATSEEVKYFSYFCFWN